LRRRSPAAAICSNSRVSGEGVGQRNIAAAKSELEKLGVPLEAEDVGGEYGRTVEFTPGTECSPSRPRTATTE